MGVFVESGSMRNMRIVGFCGLCLVLSACDSADAKFCKGWISAGLGAGTDIEWLETAITDRPLTPLEAQRTIFPNYDPNALFKRRPDNIPNILFALEAVPAQLHTVSISYHVVQDGAAQTQTQTCEFLRLAENLQHVSDADLYSFLQRQQNGMGNDSCCIQTNEEVR
ncbi:hypothetical protein JCM17844_00420 [Iodidimonas gelatinilytica]|uniref:Uncharacterized protein n=2 Tax=Iodidimonas gelatinilytica TaxID=1236966 RepID=A0A5A7MN14_9PROT|nr:hypothetical protein JCM17844_00420 [Iodidimonas gelatinilytica]